MYQFVSKISKIPFFSQDSPWLVFFGPNQSDLIKANQGQYWASMLVSVLVDDSVFLLMPIVNAYWQPTGTRSISFTQFR